jgi:hypothetical protein
MAVPGNNIGGKVLFLPSLRNGFPIRKPGIIIYPSGNPYHQEYVLSKP